ncbi:sensor histidine kinase [Allostreptomyces psammosilenae]|uniref:histidine kinase n=1 Tax=Allostreptomyces psammosilenae TaxID=1892865 RepID=A0A853AA08_9ACTN|nr:sensor histidine kinase [Allostreptomyces psammosilenae]NYI07348.1 signal transduction histidine kinase [Allostreptomyces psammosilenae]
MWRTPTRWRTPSGGGRTRGALPRGRAGDLALVAAVAVVCAATALLAVRDGRSATGLFTPLDCLALVAVPGALQLRRRHPVAVGMFTLLASILYFPSSSVDAPVLLAFVVALYTVAARGNLTAAVILGALALLAVVYGEVSGSGTRNVDDIALFMFTGWLVAVIAVGGVVNNRRAYLREAERRAADAERGREEALARRATEERLRIARELHDVLGHHISLINVQASAALHRLGRSGETAGTSSPAADGAAEEALGAIKEASREALRELRSTLGVLRQVDEEAPTAPAPGLSRLTELTERAGATGLEVRARIEGSPRPLPPGVDLAAYRIVQEALTNVTRHADARRAVVRVHYGEEEIRVEVDDDGRGGPLVPGDGIRGMAERARALGGEFAAGPRPEGGCRVGARLPLGGAR